MKSKKAKYNQGGLTLRKKTIGELNVHLGGQYSNESSAASVGLQHKKSSVNVNIPTNKGGGYNISGQTSIRGNKITGSINTKTQGYNASISRDALGGRVSANVGKSPNTGVKYGIKYTKGF
jgi:hypothetical protein|tara:strand:- start:76 stop:438 length:363 start_codon:yes stop_codon:yes gene_type:complete